MNYLSNARRAGMDVTIIAQEKRVKTMIPIKILSE